MELDNWSHPYRDKLAPCHSACGLARSGQGRVKVLTLAKQHLDPISPRDFQIHRIKTIQDPILQREQQSLKHVRELPLLSKHHRCFVLHQLIDRHSRPAGLRVPSATLLTTWARPKCLFASTCQTHGTQPRAIIYIYEEEHKPIQP